MSEQEHIDTIATMAYKLKTNNPAISDEEAIEQALQNYLTAKAKFCERLTEIKASLSKEDWQVFTKILTTESKSKEELEACYNQMLESNQLINGITVSDIELEVEYEGVNTQKVIPAGTPIKISRAFWFRPGEFIEIWTLPGKVDYALRQDILALS